MELIKSFVEAEQTLHDLAVKATGFDDFGPTEYVEGLRILLKAYDNEALFNDKGHFTAQAMLVNCLKGRLLTQAGVKQNPECLDHKIERPIFVVGLPRTGTTILHRLLSQDSNNQGLEYWLGISPMVRPPRKYWTENLCYQEVATSLQMMRELNPDMQAIHEMTVDGVDECRLLLMHSFANVTFQSNATIPSYEQWLYNADMSGVYQQYEKALKLIGTKETDKRWILKDPSHLWAMDRLLERFPDACIVQTHRDPVKLIASVSSLVYTARKIGEPDISAAAIGLQQLEQWKIVLEKAMAVREKFPNNFYDVYFDDFINDPVTVVDNIYTNFGGELRADAAEQLRQWMITNPQGKHGGHQYRPEDFGLTEAQIRDHYGNYQSQFFK